MTRDAASRGDSLVSVIVPAYNHESYIVECLQSVQEQTHDRVELIIIDDCSSDSTFELVKNVVATAFARRFENIVLHQKLERGGVHDSLNIGLKWAKGDYIAIANGDDLLRPRRLERLLDVMRDSGAEIAFSLVDVIDVESLNVGSIPMDLLLLQFSQPAALARDLSTGFALLRRNVAISSGNCMFTAEIAKRIGGFRGLRNHYAWDFLLHSLVYAEPVAVNEPLYGYRLHSKNFLQQNERLLATENEALYRRFFRTILSGRPANRLCPCPENWPGYFEAIVRTIGLWDYWTKEAGGQLPFWRTYDRAEWGAAAAPGLITSTEEAVRFFSQSNDADERRMWSSAS